MVAVLAVREVAVRVLHPNLTFTPLSLGSPVVATIVCTAMAFYVFVSISHIMGGGWPEGCALMAMHVVVWAVCVTLLPSLAITKHPPKTQAPDRPLSIFSRWRQ